MSKNTGMTAEVLQVHLARLSVVFPEDTASATALNRPDGSWVILFEHQKASGETTRVVINDGWDLLQVCTVLGREEALVEAMDVTV